jgi:(R,R)-butanediol dehydrogenase / meso-butanediol dehydrogenase / diacetyl reductase
MSTTTMPAAVYQGEHTITVEELPVPELAADEVLLEISHCGICGSDLHMMMEDWGRAGTTGGHEYSGTIVAVGAAVEGWAVGDRVVGGPDAGCGACEPCAAGWPHLCLGKHKAGLSPYQGAFAAFKACRQESLYRIPDGLDLRTAALTEPLAVALHGVLRADPRPGQRALVTGAGPIGLLTVVCLRELGIDDVTVSEPSPRRQERAAAVGAARVVGPADLVAPALPMDVVDQPFHLAVDASGRPDAMDAALAHLGRRGVLVLSGTGMKRPRFDTNRIILNELTITGSVEYVAGDYHLALELLASGRLPTDLLIEPADVPLAGVQRAMEQLVAGQLPGKVMVRPRA